MADPAPPIEDILQIRCPTEQLSPYTVNPAVGTIEVRIQGPDGDVYQATITDFPSGSAIAGATNIPLNFVSSGVYRNFLPVGSIPTTLPSPLSMNKQVVVTESQISGSGSGSTVVIGSMSETFFVWTGSGSGSGSFFAGVGVGVAGGAASPTGFARTKQPIPVALQLEPDGPGESAEAGDYRPLARLTSLLFCHIPSVGPCWLSEPIDLGADDGASTALGFWQLHRHDPCTWALQLRQGGIELATYRLTVDDAEDFSFPIRLAFVAGADARCTLPATLTVSPAP